MAASVNPSIPQPFQYSQTLNNVGQLVSSTVALGLGGRLLSQMSIATGAMLGFSTAATQIAFFTAEKALGLDEKIASIPSPAIQSAAKVARVAVNLLASLKIATMITTACGYPILFKAALILNVKLIVVTLSIAFIGACLLGCCKIIDRESVRV